MRVSVIVAALAVVASARSFGRRQAPQCAMNCVISAESTTGCGTDVKCLCTKQEAVDSVRKCVETNCKPDEIKAALAFACKACADAGAPLPGQVCPPPTA